MRRGLGLLAQELANSAAQHAQHELQLAQRRWAMAEQHRVRARELKVGGITNSRRFAVLEGVYSMFLVLKLGH